MRRSDARAHRRGMALGVPRQGTRRRRIGALGVAVAAASLGWAPAGVGPAAAGQVIPKDRPAPVRDLELKDKRGQSLPLYLQFKDQTGRIVSLADHFNRPTADGRAKRPVVIQLQYFRCPILCPTILNKFTDTLKGLDFSAGDQFDVLVVSVDHRDTPEDAARMRELQLASYGRDPKTSESGWTYLVGAESARNLADALGFEYRWVEPAKEYAHGAALFVATPDGRVSRVLTGLNYPARDVRLALLEASGGRIGDAFDAFTLWCYHFDPDSGSYTLAAMRVMRAGAGATVLLLGGLLGAMALHERRVRRAGPRTPARTGFSDQTPPGPGSPRPPAALTGPAT